MAIYEYKCICGNKAERILPFTGMGTPQYCNVCDKGMTKVLSVMQPPVMAKTGADMALATLNSKEGAFPPGRPYTKAFEKKVAAGL